MIGLSRSRFYSVFNILLHLEAEQILEKVLYSVNQGSGKTFFEQNFLVHLPPFHKLVMSKVLEIFVNLILMKNMVRVLYEKVKKS